MVRLCDAGVSLLLLTHDRELVAQTASQVTAMASGRTCFTGTPSDLLYNEELVASLALIPPPVVQISRALTKEGISAPRWIRESELIAAYKDRGCD